MKNNIFVIVKKELMRVFTDRRLVFTSFILPALSIALMYSVMGSMIGNMVNDREEHTASAIIIDAPETFKNLVANQTTNLIFDFDGESNNVENYKRQIFDGDLELLVQFPKGFQETVTHYDGNSVYPDLIIHMNSGEDYSRDASRTMNHVLSDYENYLLGQRMGNPKLVNVFDINRESKDVDLVDEQKSVGQGFGNLLPVLISIFLFSGAMGIGMDSIAGEKERGTMATLLVTPVKREEIAIGKILSLAIVAIISATSSFIGILISLPFSGRMFGSGDSIDISALQFGAGEFLMLASVMITLVGLYVGLIVLISVISNSVKEAGTYISPVYIVVMIAGFLNMFTTGTPETWQYAVPVYGSVVALKSIFTFELTMPLLILTCTSSIIVTGILIWIIQKMFNSERVMFSS